MPTKLSIPDQRMLQLMEWAVKNNLVTTEGDYWERIGYQRTNISKVRKGDVSFGRDAIINACKLTGASADWILGLSTAMFRETAKKTSVQLLREVTAQIEQQLDFAKIGKAKNGVNSFVNGHAGTKKKATKSKT